MKLIWGNKKLLLASYIRYLFLFSFDDIDHNIEIELVSKISPT